MNYQNNTKDELIIELQKLQLKYDTLKASHSKDITEHKLAEKALRESEKQYRMLTEGMADVVWILNMETMRFSYVSPSVKKLRGYTPEEVLNQPVGDSLTPESHKRVNDLMKIRFPHFLAQAEKPISYVDEIDQPHKNGSIVHTEVITSYLLNEDGKLEVVGVSRDITERRQAEEKLKESNSRLELAMQSANIAWWEMDITTGLVTSEKRKAEMLGYAPEKFKHYKDFMALVHPDDKEKAMDAMRKHIDGSRGKYEVEYRILNNSGGYKWFYDIGEIVKRDSTGKPLKVTGLVIDISDRKQMEIDLIASEENLISITSNTPDHIIVQDNKLRYTFVVNPQLGLTKEQYIGRSDFEIGLSEKDAVHLTSIKRKVLETGNPVKIEVPLKNLSGNTEYFDGSLIPKFDTDGKVNGLIGYFRNVTNQKKSIESIKEYQKKLLSLTRYLEEVRENERSHIAMNLHDDLGQRLTSLNLDLGWMKSRMGVQSQGLRKKMEEMSRSIIETIESIKEVSSFLRPSILYELGLIAAFTWQLEKFRKQSGIKYHFSFKPAEFRIDDHISLIIYRVLQESLTNIIRHSEASSVEIVLIYKKAKIELTIKDNGVGIDKAKINSITSMGIAGLMERVKSVSGTLSVIGEKGSGTTLIASIPLKKKKNHD